MGNQSHSGLIYIRYSWYSVGRRENFPGQYWFSGAACAPFQGFGRLETVKGECAPDDPGRPFLSHSDRKERLVDERFERPYPSIEADACKSCGRCAAACPKGCLAISETYNRYGVKAVAYKGSGCIGCGICFYNCPEPYAIRIVRKGGAQ